MCIYYYIIVVVIITGYYSFQFSVIIKKITFPTLGERTEECISQVTSTRVIKSPGGGTTEQTQTSNSLKVIAPPGGTERES